MDSVWPEDPPRKWVLTQRVSGGITGRVTETDIWYDGTVIVNGTVINTLRYPDEVYDWVASQEVAPRLEGNDILIVDMMLHLVKEPNNILYSKRVESTVPLELLTVMSPKNRLRLDEKLVRDFEDRQRDFYS